MIEILIILVILVVLIWPVKLAADYVGAKNTGILMCVVALIFAAAIQKAVAVLLPQLAFNYPALNPLVSILLSAFAYMLILGTSYGKGIVIAILQIIISVILIFVFGLLGLSVGAFVF
ncbi:MAG: hypothetical protein P8047_17455 [Gammaproteobacteria bacterium]